MQIEIVCNVIPQQKSQILTPSPEDINSKLTWMYPSCWGTKYRIDLVQWATIYVGARHTFQSASAVVSRLKISFFHFIVHTGGTYR